MFRPCAWLPALLQGNPGTTVYVPGCWSASDDAATLVRTHGAISSVRTVGLEAHQACSWTWRQQELKHQTEHAAIDILTAAAARQVLPPACAGTDPLRFVGPNGTLARVKRRRHSRGGPGCVALVIEADVLLTADALRDACLYFGAEAYDAVVHARLPLTLPRASRHPSHSPAAAAHALKLPERACGNSLGVSRHVAFLSMRSLDALATLSLIHAPRLRQSTPKGGHEVCPLDALVVTMLPALGLSTLWLGGSSVRGGDGRCGFIAAGPACRPVLLAGALGVPGSTASGASGLSRRRERRLAMDDSMSAYASKRRSKHSRLAPQYGCSAVGVSAHDRCVLPPAAPAAADAPASLGRPPLILDAALWEPTNESLYSNAMHQGNACGQAGLECVALPRGWSRTDGAHTRHGAPAMRTPQLVVRADARSPSAAAVIGVWSSLPPLLMVANGTAVTAPLSRGRRSRHGRRSMPHGAPSANAPPPSPPQPIHFLTVHLPGRIEQLVARPLLDAIAAVRVSADVEYVYPSDSLRRSRAAHRRRKGHQPSQLAADVDTDILAPHTVPLSRRVHRPFESLHDGGVEAVATNEVGAPAEAVEAGFLGLRWRALAAVLLMVTGWLLLASGARCILLRISGDEQSPPIPRLP